MFVFKMAVHGGQCQSLSFQNNVPRWKNQPTYSGLIQHRQIHPLIRVSIEYQRTNCSFSGSMPMSIAPSEILSKFTLFTIHLKMCKQICQPFFLYNRPKGTTDWEGPFTNIQFSFPLLLAQVTKIHVKRPTCKISLQQIHVRKTASPCPLPQHWTFLHGKSAFPCARLSSTHGTRLPKDAQTVLHLSIYFSDIFYNNSEIPVGNTIPTNITIV